jgi:hypothetical protein
VKITVIRSGGGATHSGDGVRSNHSGSVGSGDGVGLAIGRVAREGVVDSGGVAVGSELDPAMEAQPVSVTVRMNRIAFDMRGR